MKQSQYNGSRLTAHGSRDVIADSLRGFAIILVVYAHVVLWFESSSIFLPRSIVVSKYIYSFHMPLMFMVAGYVHAMKERYSQPFMSFAKKYLVDIYLPCMYFSVLQIIIMLTVFSSSNPANFGTVKPGEIYAIPFVGFKEYWFLAALFFVKIMHTFWECRTKHLQAVSVFWVVVFLTVPYLSKVSPLLLRDVISRMSMGLYFHVGFLLKRSGCLSRAGVWHGLVLLAAGFACFAGGWNIPAGAAMSTSLALFVVFYALKVNYAPLVTCGVYSMVIYCLHNWITAVFRLFSKITGLASSASPVMLFVMCFPAAMLLPLVAVRLYKKVKAFRWLEYLFYPGKLFRLSAQKRTSPV